MKKVVLLSVAVVALVFSSLIYQVVQFMSLNKSSRDMIFEVQPGASFNKITQTLHQERVIVSPFKLKLYAKLTGQVNAIRVGEYQLVKGMTAPEILSVLTSGKSISHKVTFQEGINIYEMAELLQSKGLFKKAEFLELSKDKSFIKRLLNIDVDSFEGYLFPDTYSLTKYTSLKSFFTIMVNRFKKEFEKAKSQATIKDMSPHDVVILASIIEKETGAPEERPLISSVFHNRLKKKMRIQSDPTIIYGILVNTGIVTKNIRKKDIRAHTKYNTYTVKALPHGPIANPGFESLKAAMAPKASSYLYFVSRNDGTHKFTKNYKDHLKAVRNYQLNEKAREGKSWRDLKNR